MRGRPNPGPKRAPSGTSSSLVPVGRSTGAVTRSTPGGAGGGMRGTMVPPGYRPPPEDSDYVHDEIKELAADTKKAFQKLGRPTDEAALLQRLQFTGPSKESKAMLEKEKLAAETAMSSGVYVTYRNERKNEECFRLGPSHQCFCQHSLSQHAQPKANKRGFLVAPACELCACSGYSYVPNQPEEIGEGWLSRRAKFDLAAWSPKCCCNHGSKDHSSSGSRRCRTCGCGAFQSQFACVVCDCFWEEHETVFESRGQRVESSLPVDSQYQPLSQVDPAFSELVFENQLEDRPARPAIAGPPTAGGVKCPPMATAGKKKPSVVRELPPWCESCAFAIKDPSANFCPKCGARR